MEAVLTSAVAVIGTLLGVVVTHVFQRLASQRTELFMRSEALRQERVAAYSFYAAAVEDFRRGQADRWYRKQEACHDEYFRAVDAEAHRLRAVARQSLYRVKLVTAEEELIQSAEQALQSTRDVSNARNQEERNDLDDRAQNAIEAFVLCASTRVR